MSPEQTQVLEAKSPETKNVFLRFAGWVRETISPEPEKRERMFQRIFGTEIPYVPIEFANQVIAELRQEANGDESVNEVIMLLEKAMNPATSEYVVATVKDFLRNLPQNVRKLIIGEFGVGSGISTLILALQLGLTGKEFQIIAVDKNKHSIACAQKILNHFKINNQVFSSPDKIPAEFSGVAFINNDFVSAAMQLPDKKIHGIYSNHGVSYLAINNYKRMMGTLVDKLAEGGILTWDYLDNNLKLKLSPKWTSRMVMSGVFRSHRRSSVKDYHKQNEQNEIEELYRGPEKRFLDWMSYLLRTGRTGVLKMYKGALDSSQRAQRSYNPEARMLFQTTIPSNLADKLELVKSTIELNILPPFVQTVTLKKR